MLLLLSLLTLVEPVWATYPTPDYCCEWKYGSAELVEKQFESDKEAIPQFRQQCLAANLNPDTCRGLMKEHLRKPVPAPPQASAVPPPRKVDDWPPLSALEAKDVKLTLEKSPQGGVLGVLMSYDLVPVQNGTASPEPTVAMNVKDVILRGHAKLNIVEARIVPAPESDGEQRTPATALSRIRLVANRPYHVEVKLYPEFVERQKNRFCIRIPYLGLGKQGNERWLALMSIKNEPFQVSIRGTSYEKAHPLAPLSAFYEGHRKNGALLCGK
ncbi:MAG TPA: hypothetical protein VM598_03365 [Bdellovibrionota bacterium]|nr:hypothetical protein [Bdellovibrionota bacterium]